MVKVVKVDDSVFKKKLDRAFLEAGLLVTNRAKELCPAETGRLRASIRFNRVGNSIEIGTVGVPYAEFVEYGTGPMVKVHGKHDPSNPVTNWEALRKRGGVGQAMPFLRTALFEKKFEIPKIFERAFR